MLVARSLRRGQVRVLVATLGLFLVVAFFLQTTQRSIIREQVPQWSPAIPPLAEAKPAMAPIPLAPAKPAMAPIPLAPAKPATAPIPLIPAKPATSSIPLTPAKPKTTSIPPAPIRPTLPLPQEYSVVPPQSEYCTDRFSAKYLENLRDNAVEYCAPGSRSTLTCFHSHTAEDGKTDSMCIGRGAVLGPSGKFTLDCAVRQLAPDEMARGLVPFKRIRSYWYDTGPPRVMQKAVSFFSGEVEPARGQQAGGGAEARPRFYVLVKREGALNPWHCLMEIWSSWLAIDVLRMAARPRRDGDGDDTHGAPFFRAPEDIADTQVVVLDNHVDGPYFDLWTLFAGRRPVRLSELVGSEPAGPQALGGGGSDIIIPLAGASNPAWQNDWKIRDCTTSATLSTFVARVLGFYGIADKPPPRQPQADIVVTFIDRRGGRKLKDQAALIAALEATPNIDVQVVDFAALPFADQIRVARETDVLVGVHGAGLTHMMFMPAGAGAVVEILPPTLDHMGFRNLAAMRQQNYFRVHGTTQPGDGGNATDTQEDWHGIDVVIEPERFLDVVGVAVKSLYSQGPRNQDIV